MASQPTNKHAALSVTAIESYIAALQKQRIDIDAQIVEAQEALKYQQRQCNAVTVPVRDMTRRKKGEVLAQLRDLYKAEPDLGLTVSGIADRLKLPASSLQNVLRKQPMEFIQGPDGLWRRKGLVA